MPPTLRARSVLVALTTLCAAVPLAAAATSCGGGGGSSTGAKASDGGSRDRGPGDDGMVAGDDATPDGTIALADAPTGDAGDPCAADTGGTSGTTSITAVWANEGGDKVTQDELRATGHATAVVSSVWDGRCIRTFGAKNEVVSFNVVLEAATSKATKVSVSLGDLTGPGGTVDPLGAPHDRQAVRLDDDRGRALLRAVPADQGPEPAGVRNPGELARGHVSQAGAVSRHDAGDAGLQARRVGMPLGAATGREQVLPGHRGAPRAGADLRHRRV